MSAELGSAEWLAERTEQAIVAGRVHRGAPTAVDVVIAGGPSGTVTYHVVLSDNAPPSYQPGPAPGGAAATLEQTWADANALDRGEADLAVAYMRGETKTKGATRPVIDLLRLLVP